jgi:protein-tyrosine phosphatase
MRILMVCLGNICRSPLAQGILEHKLEQRGINHWHVDSAGTSSWHIGDLPDRRSISIARDYGIDLTTQRARQIVQSDLRDFDLILAMDQSNFNDILRLSSNNSQSDKIKLILNYVYPGTNLAVPDPYYDGSFQRVFDLLDQAADRIIQFHEPKLVE